MRKLAFISVLILLTTQVWATTPTKGQKPKKNIDEVSYKHVKAPKGLEKNANKSASINIRLVDVEGNLVMERQAGLMEFLDKDGNIEGLPENALFIVLRGNTAFYLAENDIEDTKENEQ